MRLRKSKRCPRCNYKCDLELLTCPSCKLSFVKFNSASNKEAKIAIKEHRTDDVVMRDSRHNDVRLWKLLLIVIFLGLAGVHNYYVGRYKRGIIFSVFFVIGVVNAILVAFVPNLNMQSDIWQVFYILTMGWAVILLMWITDIVNIILNRFKIPVSRKV